MLQCPICQAKMTEGSRVGEQAGCENRHMLMWDGERWEYSKKTTSAGRKPSRKKTGEANVQDQIAHHFSESGWLVVRVNSFSRVLEYVNKKTNQVTKRLVESYRIFGIKGTGMKSCAGFPDLVCFKGTTFVLIEVKDTTGTLELSQSDFARFASRFGVEVRVMRSVEQAEAFTAKLEGLTV